MSDSALAVAFMLELAKCSILTDSYPTHYHIKSHSKSLPLPKMFILQAIVKDLISSCNALSNETIAIFLSIYKRLIPAPLRMVFWQYYLFVLIMMLLQLQIWTVAKIFVEILNQNTDLNKVKEDIDIENDFYL